MDNSTYFIALGANLPSPAGAPARTLVAALRALVQAGAELRAVSRFYHAPAFPAGAGPDYVNAAAAVSSGLDPAQFLALLHRIEADLGRQRAARWESRGVDLDLLAAGDTILPDARTQAHWRGLALADQMRDWPEGLILPHPRLADRAFVLIPLAEIAPLWRHPATGDSVMQMLAALPQAEKAAIRPLGGPFCGEGRLSRPGLGSK